MNASSTYEKMLCSAWLERANESTEQATERHDHPIVFFNDFLWHYYVIIVRKLTLRTTLSWKSLHCYFQSGDFELYSYFYSIVAKIKIWVNLTSHFHTHCITRATGDWRIVLRRLAIQSSSSVNAMLYLYHYNRLVVTFWWKICL